MSKFPVEYSDKEGVVDAVNYLLAGPAGLGQNFAGYSAYQPAYLTGNYRVPYTQTDPAPLYVAPIPLLQSEMLDGRTWKFTFATAQPTPPFRTGNIIRVNGSSDNYNGAYNPIGVTECTTTYVIARTNGTYPVLPPVPGGTVQVNVVYGDGTNPPDGANSTDANARVTVTGATDRVFISAQLNNDIRYTVPTGSDTLTYTVELNRYYAVPNNDPTNPDFVFLYSDTVALKSYTYSVSGSGTLPTQETIFTTILDRPAPAYYWYILEVVFKFNNTDSQILSNRFGLRSLSAQVVKQ